MSDERARQTDEAARKLSQYEEYLRELAERVWPGERAVVICWPLPEPRNIVVELNGSERIRITGHKQVLVACESALRSLLLPFPPVVR